MELKWAFFIRTFTSKYLYGITGRRCNTNIKVMSLRLETIRRWHAYLLDLINKSLIFLEHIKLESTLCVEPVVTIWIWSFFSDLLLTIRSFPTLFFNLDFKFRFYIIWTFIYIKSEPFFELLIRIRFIGFVFDFLLELKSKVTFPDSFQIRSLARSFKL